MYVEKHFHEHFCLLQCNGNEQPILLIEFGFIVDNENGLFAKAIGPNAFPGSNRNEHLYIYSSKVSIYRRIGYLYS